MEFFQRVDPSKAVWLGGGGMNICSINIKLTDYITVASKQCGLEHGC